MAFLQPFFVTMQTATLGLGGAARTFPPLRSSERDRGGRRSGGWSVAVGTGCPLPASPPAKAFDTAAV